MPYATRPSTPSRSRQRRANKRRKAANSVERTPPRSQAGAWLQKIAQVTFTSAGIGALIIVGSIVYTCWGKLVILPFEVSGDTKDEVELGKQLATGLSQSLNMINKLFLTSDYISNKLDIKQNYDYDILQEYMLDLPESALPRASQLDPLSLANAQIGGISIPVYQVVAKILPQFDQETVYGQIGIWGNEIIAHVRIGGFDEFTIRAKKQVGYKSLIDQISIEILKRKGVVALHNIKSFALLHFLNGAQWYADYMVSQDENDLELARESYNKAVEVDRSFELARLHLATAQFQSRDPEILRRSMQSFLPLLGSERYSEIAKLGHLISTLRFLEHSDDCKAIEEYLSGALAGAAKLKDSASVANYITTFARALAYHKAGSFLLESDRCHAAARSAIPTYQVMDLFLRAEAGYKDSLNQFSSAPKFRTEDKFRREKLRQDFYIRSYMKYLQDEMADYFIEMHRYSDAKNALAGSLSAGGLLMSEGARKVFAPYLRGSLAESELRLALVSESDASRQTAITSAASQLEAAINDDNPDVARWASLRLAEVDAMREDFPSAFMYIGLFFQMTNGPDTQYREGVDNHALALGLFALNPSHEREAQEAIEAALKTDNTNVLIYLLLSITYLAENKIEDARSAIKIAEERLQHNNFWYGDGLPLAVHLQSAIVAEHGVGSAENELVNRFKMYSKQHKNLLTAALMFRLSELRCGKTIFQEAQKNAKMILGNAIGRVAQPPFNQRRGNHVQDIAKPSYFDVVGQRGLCGQFRSGTRRTKMPPKLPRLIK
jgi:tetratricopeptide (TPR) repeat protein